VELELKGWSWVESHGFISNPTHGKAKGSIVISQFEGALLDYHCNCVESSKVNHIRIKMNKNSPL